MTEPIISVIMPTYNHSSYIRQALDSVLMQQCSYPMEILVGDDASTDGTQEILKAYQIQYPGLIRLFLQEKNIGATRNAYGLLVKARGKYLATLEGDDYWTDPQKLQIQVDFLEAQSQYVGCTHKFSVVDEYGRQTKRQKLSWVRQKAVFSLKDFDGLTMPGQPSTFVRRNLFINPSNDYSICYKIHPLIADRTLMLIFLSKGAFGCIDRNMSHYRKAQGKYAKNISTQMYRHNSNRLQMDFQYLLALEHYAKNTLHIHVNFESRKRMAFLEAVLGWIRCPRKAQADLVRYILNHCHNKKICIILFPFLLCKKIGVFFYYHV